MQVGVYFCQCGTNIADKIDAEQVGARVRGLPGVAYFRAVGFLCSEEGQGLLEEDLRHQQPDRVVIAACSPREHENTFRRILAQAGINPYLLQMVNLREQVAWVTAEANRAADKAFAYLRAAVSRVQLHEPLEKETLEVCPDVLIIGAGPAGLRAALSLAEAGRKVVLVEESPLIGGLPVRFEEVFPSLECGPCMIEPLLQEVLHGEPAERIEILTLSQVEEVTGYYGNFLVKVRRHPRSVDVPACIGCGECLEPCPVSVPNAWNGGMDERKAIAVPFLGALPNVPFIDRDACVRFQGEDCQACRDACPMGEGVIRFEETEAVLERKAGAIVVAIGASLYDCQDLPNLGYGRVRDVYTSLEFERILSSTGPTGGRSGRRMGAGRIRWPFSIASAAWREAIGTIARASAASLPLNSTGSSSKSSPGRRSSIFTRRSWCQERERPLYTGRRSAVPSPPSCAIALSRI